MFVEVNADIVYISVYAKLSAVKEISEVKSWDDVAALSMTGMAK